MVMHTYLYYFPLSFYLNPLDLQLETPVQPQPLRVECDVGQVVHTHYLCHQAE